MSLTVLLCYVIVTLLTLALALIRYRLNYWKQQDIPHDVPSLLEGNLIGLGRTRGIADIVRDTYLKYKGTGPFCGFYFFQRPVALILDTELAKRVLIKDFANFVNRGLFHNERDDPLTGHLFLLDGQQWRNLRSKLSAVFTACKMKLMLPMIVKTGERLVEAMQEQLLKSDAVELKELLTRYTTDVSSLCTFGIDCNSLKDANAQLRLMARKMSTLSRHGPLLTGLIQAFPQLARKLHARIVPDVIHNFFMRLVREIVSYRERYNVQCNDFVNTLMKLHMRRPSNDEHNALIGLTLQQITGQSFAFFGAGVEMAATTLTNLLYEIALQPQIQARMRAEINETLQQHNNVVTYEFIKELQYMKQVIAETLRKYPILPHLVREAAADYPVPGNPKYIIPKGMAVIIPAVGIQNDPEIYAEPEKFDPERFTPEQVQTRESVEWLAFGDGPRNCIGRRYGQIQMRIALTFLLKHFSFSTNNATELDAVTSKSAPQNGLTLRVKAI